MTADEPVAGVPRLCARRADCTRPRGHDDECGPDRADTELADLRAEVRRHRLAVHDVLMACMELDWATDGSERSMVNHVREVVRRWRADKAERDALQRQVDGVRALPFQQWRYDGGGVSAEADEVEAALDAVEPADQPHPTPEADEACDVVPGKAHSLWCVTHDREPLDVWGCADEAGS